MYQMEAERVYLINNNTRSNRGSARDRSAERHKEHSHEPRDYSDDSTNIRTSTTQERYVPTITHSVFNLPMHRSTKKQTPLLYVHFCDKCITNRKYAPFCIKYR